MKTARSRAAKVSTTNDAEAWATAWLDAVVSGASTMSQRQLAVIKLRGGGLALVKKLARARGVHLVLLTDDKGSQLVAASMHPFTTLC